MPPKVQRPVESDNALDLSGAVGAGTGDNRQVVAAQVEPPPAQPGQAQQTQEPRLHRLRIPRGTRLRSNIEDPDAIDNYENEEDIYANIVADRDVDSFNWRHPYRDGAVISGLG